jgi:hypothetical protein
VAEACFASTQAFEFCTAKRRRKKKRKIERKRGGSEGVEEK